MKKHILENLDHVQILDRWIRVCQYQDIEHDRLYLAERIRKYFPEYRDLDLFDLADSLKAVFNAPAL